MRAVSDIHQKLKQAQYRHLKKLLEQNFKKRPHNCLYNESHVVRNSESQVPVRLCMYGSGLYTDSGDSEWQGTVCDPECGGNALARDCELFKPHKTKAEIRFDFQELMDSNDLPRIAINHPDVAALMWVLFDENLGMQLTWWQRLKLWWHPAHVTVDTPDEEQLPPELQS